MFAELLCPQCNSANTIFSKKKQHWVCEECENSFAEEKPVKPLRILISYGRDDYADLAERLKVDLVARGHEVWFDKEKLKEGGDWEHYIDNGLNWVSSAPETGRVVFVMTPHSVRRPDGYCLNEIAKALCKSVPVIPVMLVFSEPPLSIYRIQYLDMQDCYPPEERPAIYEQRLERLILALEENKIDFEGVQHRLISSLQPIQFVADLSKLLKDFTGRKWAFDAVDTWLADAQGSKIFWLQGAPGVGKSAIAAWLRDNRRQIAAFHFCDINSEEKRDTRKLVTSIAYQLSTQLPAYQERLASLNISDIIAQYSEAYTLFDKLIVQPMAENFPEPDRIVVILIDALDEATANHKNDIALFLSFCASKTPTWLRFMVTSRPEPEIASLFQSLSPLILDTGSEANRADIADYLRAKLPGIAEKQVKSILDKSEGVFLFAKHVCEEIHVGRLSLDNTENFPRGLGDVYTRFFLRQFKDNIEGYRKEIRPLLSLILASLRPLQLGFIMQVLGYVNRMELFDRLDTLGSLFPRSGDKETDTITPFHRSLNDWLSAKERSGQFYIDGEFGHKLLAEHGWQQYQSSPERMADYHLEYLPPHLVSVPEYERVVVVLKDFRFLMARSKAGFLGRLLSDYREIVRGLPKEQRQQLRIEESFFRSNGHILRRENEDWPAYKILLQLAIEHADDSPLTIEAEQFLEDGRCDWAWLRRELRVDHAGVDPCVAVFEGHKGSVFGALEMPNGRILSWSSDNTLRIWNKDAACLVILGGHSDPVFGARIFPDGRILSWSVDHSLRLWSYNGEPLKVLVGHTDMVTGCLLFPDGRILSWSDDHTLRLWNNIGEPLKELVGHTDRVFGCLLFTDGRILSWSDDFTLRLWNNAGEPLNVLGKHTDMVFGALLLPDEKILSWACDNKLCLWSTNGELLFVMEGHTDRVTGAHFLPDGRILSWSDDHTMRLWCVSGELINIFVGHTDTVEGALILPNGRMLSWSTDSTLRIWDAQSGTCLSILTGHIGAIGEVYPLPDGQLFSWSGGDLISDKSIRIWDSIGGRCLGILIGHTYSVIGATLLDNQILSWSSDNTLRLWDWQHGKCMEVLEGHTDSVDTLIVHTDGHILTWAASYFNASDFTLRLWDAESGMCINELIGHTDKISGARFLSDGGILSWSSDKSLRLWDERSGFCVATLEGHTEFITDILLLADGFLSCSCDNTLRLWSKTGETLKILKGHTNVVNGALHLLENQILSWSDDKTLRIWSSSGEQILVMLGHTDGVTNVLRITDGRVLSWSFNYNGSKDHALRLWSETGKLLNVLEGHSGQVVCVVLLADGRILSGADDNYIRLWSDAGDLLAVLVGHNEALFGAQLLSNDHILTWTATTFGTWSSNGELLVINDINKLFDLAPMIWQAYLSESQQIAETGLVERDNLVVIGGRSGQLLWHGASECTARHLFNDGRAIVTQANGQVCFLRTYTGDKRVTIEELEFVLHEKAPRQVLKIAS